MKTVYSEHISNEVYFKEVEAFLAAKGLRDENGERILIPDLNTYLLYYDKIKELDTKKEYKHLRQPMYTKLFQDANQFLDNAKKEHKTIHDLSSYYYELENILDLGGGPKYLRLPFEEDFFEIDTDTRTIQVPVDIINKKWTIGVTGDHLAEVLWFHVNRYYDGQDLAVCFPIENRENKTELTGYGQTYIQWKIGEGDNYRDGLDVVVHPEIDEDNIYFGWYLRTTGTNDPGPLSSFGNLTFSVRFQYHYSKEMYSSNPDFDSDLLFSFNTQPVTLTILKNLMNEMTRPGISTEGVKAFDPEDISAQAMIRPRFSTVFDNTAGQKAYLKKDLSSPIDLDENNEKTIFIEAEGPGTLGYEWYYEGQKILPEKDENQQDIPFGPSYTIKYTEGGAPVTGTYTVAVSHDHDGKTRWTYSNPAVMPAPSEISFVKDNHILPEGFSDEVHYLTVPVEKTPDRYGRETGVLHYTWYKIPLDSTHNKETVGTNKVYNTKIGDIGRYYVEIVNKHNGSSTEPITSEYCTIKARPEIPRSVSLRYDSATQSLIATVDIKHNNDLYYRWFKADKGSAGTTFVPDFNTYPISEPGTYTCHVTQKVFGLAPENNEQHVNYAISTIYVDVL